MAGFEVIVRPVVFPDIRPSPAQPVAPADDPDKGFATIKGNGGHQFTTSSSYSASASSSQRTELERRVDEARVYQKKKDGTINKKNFVDIEVANRIKMKGPPSKTTSAKKFNEGPMTGDDLTNWRPEKDIYYYRRIAEQANIEILRQNVIKKNDQAGGSSE